MTGQVVLRRQQSLLSKQSTLGSVRFAEVAGGTAAECAVICCCCPCGILNLAVLALYTLPVGICRKMLRRRQRQQQMLLVPRRIRSCSCGGNHRAVGQVYPIGLAAALTELENLNQEKEVMMRLEKEMWDTFYGTGFWRSPSQRDRN